MNFVISFFASVRPYAYWTNFHEILYQDIFRKKTVEKIQDSLNSGKNNGYFTSRPIYRVIFKFFQVSDPCGTVAGMVTPKGSMSTEGEREKKKLGEFLYLLICSFLLCLSWLLRSLVRKFRTDL